VDDDTDRNTLELFLFFLSFFLIKVYHKFVQFQMDRQVPGKGGED